MSIGLNQGTSGPTTNTPLNQPVSDTAGAAVVRPNDYNTEVAQGFRQGHTLWSKFGYNTDVDIGSEEFIWAHGGTFVRMTTADTLDIYSSSANDTSAGTGAQQLVVYGIDENWNSQIEVVALNGATAVTTTNTWLGVNRVAMFLAGSNSVNEGTITLETTTGSNVQATLPAGSGVTQQCIFFVPADHQFMTEGLQLGALKLSGGGGSPRVSFRMRVYSDVSKGDQEVFRMNLDTDVENNIGISPNLPFPIGERSMLYLTVSSDTNNTEVNARFNGILIEDPNV